MSDKQDILATSLVNGNEKNHGDGAVGEPCAQSDHEEQEHDPHFDPIISLPEIALPTLEEEEIELIKLRAKLFRYDTHENPPEWKERGTGDVKLLRHKETNAVRVLMRRDKTLKICANHFVTPFMELKPNCGSDRAWVWSVIADFADETVKPELLAIRFANADNAKKWKDAFEDAKHIVATKCKIYSESHEEDTEDEEEEENDEEEEENDEEESFKEAIENEKVANDKDDEVKDKITKEATEALENLKINTADVSSTSATTVENKS